MTKKMKKNGGKAKKGYFIVKGKVIEMKKVKVTMTVVLNDDADVEEIKRWEHHIDYAIDMDSYPEIDHIEDVKVEE